MFRIKICGITSVEDALAVARAGADAIGLNFYAKSPRRVDPAAAARITAALPERIVKVALFVNADAAEVCRVSDQLAVDLIQLHGDEPPEYLAELGGRPTVRAFRLGAAGLAPIIEYLDRCRRLGCLPQMTLIDSQVAGKYGGSGRKPDWAVAKQYSGLTGDPPLVLAGGLNPQNVAEAISTVRPAAVDTASGVESAAGIKDPAAVKAFVSAARDAFSASKS